MSPTNGRVRIEGGAITGLIDQFLANPANQTSCYPPNSLPDTVNSALSAAEVRYLSQSPLETIHYPLSAE